ncbi:mitochondrial sodium/calcium exchanger protein isoform X2 [Phyllopteryx taeniolatus]|uniref:mitochondrial sodium/calcium exchanger protein isoform X2 n=1 Tax=Phyllopteryx taeniolatus TaxID=161469 RepID=UPI002AD2DF7A|nr:mitochondrial sodium/calcium exchanger protein isoform X2 [Phyllopteryx taeniolatus]
MQSHLHLQFLCHTSPLRYTKYSPACLSDHLGRSGPVFRKLLPSTGSLSQRFPKSCTTLVPPHGSLLCLLSSPPPESSYTPPSYAVQHKLTCDNVMNVSAADRCAFVKRTPDCSIEDGFVNYLQVAFCLLPPELTPLTVILCMIWLCFLFVILGLIASKFFCPNLSAVSTSLHLTHNVAGVTFLALGNGAPDIFSAIAAFSHPHTAGLAVGALFGAGIFVTTVVAGSVALVKPFAVASRPFLRDVIFYMVAVFWTYLILYRGTSALGETLGYLGLYVVYVLTVIISAYVYSRLKRLRSASIDGVAHIQAGFESSDTYDDDDDDDVPRLLAGTDQQEYESEYRPLLQYTESTRQILLSSINPVDNRKWRRKNWKWRVLKVLKAPVEVVLLLCIPVVDHDKEDKNWRRPLNCLHLVTGPLTCVLAFQSGIFGDYLIGGQFPLWLLTLLVGLFLCAIVFCSTTNECAPRYHSVFALLGFVVSAVLISAAASEVVSILHMLGVVLSLSNTVLGLTLLAWGNSIGDCFSDITLARQGYPRMAISACFGGIIFNMLFGVGLGLLVQRIKTHSEVQLEPEGLLTWILAGSLGLSLVLSFVIVPLSHFHLGRPYGIFLLIFYSVFLIIALLTEFGII